MRRVCLFCGCFPMFVFVMAQKSLLVWCLLSRVDAHVLKTAYALCFYPLVLRFVSSSTLTVEEESNSRTALFSLPKTPSCPHPTDTP